MDKLDFNKPIEVKINDISAESEFDRIAEDFMQKYPETEIESNEEANIKKIKVCSLTAFYEMEKILTDFEEKYPLTKIYQE
jgi:hypothetical protein